MNRSVITNPLLLFLKPSYWFEKVNSDEERMQLNSIINDEDSDAFEPDPTGLYASVKIEKLSKV